MEKADEKVIAVIEPQTADGESELATQVSDIEVRAEEMMVTNDQQYTEAGEFGVALKKKMAEVTTFFAPMKKAAHDAHKQVCDRERQMLAPLKSAEKALQKAMGDYAARKEQERKAAEEMAKRLAQAEVERKLNEAIEAEGNGDSETASAAMLDAEIADTVSTAMVIESKTPKAKGVSTQTDWEITDIDLSKVPDTIAGVIIRPVDKAAVMKLIRASKGSIKIEGITYKEITKTSFRRS